MVEARTNARTTQSPIHANGAVESQLPNSVTFNLGMLFQIVTACALFFACMRYSPPLAICLTILFAPAVIRTGILSELFRRRGREFTWPIRLRCFVCSVGIVILTAFFFLLVFTLVSMMFGLAGMFFSAAVGSVEMSGDAAIVGTAGGMIWGFAAAMLASSFVILKTWIPAEFCD